MGSNILSSVHFNITRMYKVIDLPALVLVLLEREKPEPDHCITLKTVINEEMAIIKILSFSPDVTHNLTWECYSVYLTIMDDEYNVLHTCDVEEAIPYVNTYLNLPETTIKSGIMDFLHNTKSHLRN
jgi:hypothetical protein